MTFGSFKPRRSKNSKSFFFAAPSFQFGFCSKSFNNSLKPLPDRLRPKSFTEILGQDHITGETGPINSIIKNNNLSSIIFWGPPGTGKTSIARTIPKELMNSHFHEISAVSSGTSDLKEIFKLGKDLLKKGKKLILFVDEFHYFNKLQQHGFHPLTPQVLLLELFHFLELMPNI